MGERGSGFPTPSEEEVIVVWRSPYHRDLRASNLQDLRCGKGRVEFGCDITAE
jgi:hypothetical protein